MRKTLFLWLTAGLLGSLPAGAFAGGGVDADLGEEFVGGDDTRLFHAIVARYFEAETADVSRLGARWTDPDDLAVGLFVAGRAGQPPASVFDLRRRHPSWWDVGVACGLPADAWFVPVTKPPGPPYGRAYGHWQKLRDERVPLPALDDGQTRDLVAVRLLHEYFGVPVETAMSWRAGGRDVRALAVAEYRQRHAGKPGSAPAADKGRGRDDPGKRDPAATRGGR